MNFSNNKQSIVILVFNEKATINEVISGGLCVQLLMEKNNWRDRLSTLKCIIRYNLF